MSYTTSHVSCCCVTNILKTLWLKTANIFHGSVCWLSGSSGHSLTLFIHLSICPFFCLLVCPCLPMEPPIKPSFCLSFLLPSLPSLTYFLLSIHLFIQPSHLYTHLHIHPFIHPPVCPFSHLSVHLFIHLPIYPRLWAFAEKLARLRKQGHRLGFIGHNLATRGGALAGRWVGMGM